MSARAESLSRRAPAWLQCAAIGLGSGAIAFQKPWYPSMFGVFLVGALGVYRTSRAPVQDAAFGARALRWCAAVGAGCLAFAITRSFSSHYGVQLSASNIVFLTFVAIAEELFFRRYVYGFVESRAGAGWAIGVSAVLFAFAHFPMYGARAMPVDLAAGLVLGWQRWVSGTWTATAVTHIVANFIQMG